jgi:Rad3-related DNA helicase
MDWDRKEYTRAALQFKPIKVDHVARKILWDTSDQWLLMSASFVGVAQVAKDLGLEDDEWAVVEMDSTFPVENRPIIVARDTDMSYKNKDRGWPELVVNMQELLDEHPGERVLVHTVSYELADYLMNNLNPGRTMTYHSAKERDAALEQFRNTDDGVLLAPSFDRGIDLPHDECRLIIVAKMPYPYLKDKVVEKRMYLPGGRVWYTVETLRTLVQMTGRGVRSADDWAETWILDSQFRRLWRQWERIFPRWWREAVILSLTNPKYQDRLEKIRARRHLWRNGERSKYRRRERR